MRERIGHFQLFRNGRPGRAVKRIAESGDVRLPAEIAGDFQIDDVLVKLPDDRFDLLSVVASVV